MMCLSARLECGTAVRSLRNSLRQIISLTSKEDLNW
jgi:hypothetical protein